MNTMKQAKAAHRAENYETVTIKDERVRRRVSGYLPLKQWVRENEDRLTHPLSPKLQRILTGKQ